MPRRTDSGTPLRSRWSALLAAGLVVVVLASACTSDTAPTIASVDAAADRLLAAWNAKDYEALAGMVSPQSTGNWTAAKLKRVFTNMTRDGLIRSFHAARRGAVAQPSPVASPSGLTIAVPYSVTYESDAVRHPVVMNGRVGMIYDPEGDSWGAVWKRDVMFPVARGAPARLHVDYEWPERGAILDRHRRPLARRGPPEDRSYPYGAVAGSTVGNLQPLTAKDVADGEPGSVGDLVGGSGLEAAFNEELAGTPTTRLSVLDAHGKVLDVLGRKKGTDGRSVRTTLDVDVQRAAENAYGDTVGGAVVMDPRSGDLLAIVSSSPFDPGNYVGTDVSPFNRALFGLYPPGSSMKVVTSAAALDTGTMTPETELTGPKEYQGVRNFEGEHFASLSFASALKYSVNTAFAQVALKLGGKKLYRYAKAFGFDRKPAMPLAAATSSFPYPKDAADLMFGAIGQAQVVATPLEMASVAATVANDGKRMEPRISFDQDETGERAMSKKHANELTDMMVGVVVGGTGSAANVTGLDVAGKTGTAEVDVGGKRKNHAWFICFAPADDPVVAVAVVSEYGGVGGEVAAPLARQILLGAWPYVSKS